MSRYLIGGQGNLDVGVSDEERDTTEKTYDPFWNNAVRFLDLINDASLLQRDLLSALLGQIVLVKGNLVVIDPSIVKDCYKIPVFKHLIRSGSAPQMIFDKKANAKEQNQHVDFVIELLSRMPHSTQAHLFGENFSVWSSLSESSMVSTSTDLMLRDGAFVPGPWNMIGVLDSFPKHRLFPNSDGQIPDFDKLIQETLTAPITNLMANLAPIIRNLVGRPEQYYGMTPLVIFREVGPGLKEEVSSQLGS